MIEIAIAGRGRRDGVVCIFANTFAGAPAAALRRTKFALPCLNFERPVRKQMADAAKKARGGRSMKTFIRVVELWVPDRTRMRCASVVTTGFPARPGLPATP
ncbi:hypothetical protein ACRQ5Q_20400 [Bradyrhizobium sp. PMVTL-01]|uniref:hypothetical protein n=1 Tax=Bradyrhizobium sp. PMVTL-01 TaxID=3434999 RepID=UPI003F6F57F6